MSARNNEALRALFKLPPIPASASTAMAVTEAPRPKSVTGDQEVDAVLWLQRIVATGDQTLIDKAMEAVKRITTPMDELGQRYGAHVARSTGSPMGGAFASFGFGDLEDQAKRAVDKAARRHEALARFGDVDTALAETPAEKACKKALRGLKLNRKFGTYDDKAEVMDRFNRAPNLAPATIDDCLYARDYWNRLHWLRNAIADFSDSTHQGYAHESYCHDMLAHLRPRDATEALAAFDQLDADDGTDWERTQPIIRNLIACGWNHTSQRSAASIADERGLLPCPFCGSEAFETFKTGDDWIRRHSVHCKDPNCGGQTRDRHFSEAKAIAAWNRRAALASAPVAERQYHYRMSNCTPGRPKCRDGNGYPDCPCWHDVGTGPLKGKEATATDWRDKPMAAPASAAVAGEAHQLAEALRDWHGKGDGITTTIPDELAQALYVHLRAEKGGDDA